MAQPQAAPSASTSASSSICYPARTPTSPAASSIGPIYLLYFVDTHSDFRLQELDSACKYLQLDYALIPTPLEQSLLTTATATATATFTCTSNWSPSIGSPFHLCHLPCDNSAQLLSTRLILLRSIHQLWSDSISLTDLHYKTQLPTNSNLWKPFIKDRTWKANVIRYNRTNSSTERTKQTIEEFHYMDFKGDIDLKNPSFQWSVLFEYPSNSGVILAPKVKGKLKETENLDDYKQVFLGKLVTDEKQLARNWVHKLDLKKRNYIGNTSMEAEMSLIMASMALAGPSTLILDPFAGTGSMLYSCAAFGSMTVGSDIDIRMMRGKDKQEKTGVIRSATQYGLQGKIMDCLGCDMTQHPWRVGGIFDAIVTDPPYGVRAGAKRLGRKDPSKLKTAPYILPSGEASHTLPDYVPPSKPYHLLDLISDLLEFSAFLIKPGGRLVFWIPTMTEVETFGIGIGNETGIEERPVELPESKDFRLVAHSLQDFGKWGRRLVTMERLHPNPSLKTSEKPKPWHINPSQHVRGNEKDKINYGEDPREFRNQYYTTMVDKSKSEKTQKQNSS